MKLLKKLFVQQSEVGVQHAGIILDKRFPRAIDAWNWAMWNYKGRTGWRLKFITRWVPAPADTEGNEKV